MQALRSVRDPRRKLPAASALAVLLAATLAQGVPPAAAEAPPAGAPAGHTIGGIQWSNVVRVTVDPGPDVNPEIHVAANRSVTVFWLANRSGDSGYWFTRLNASGQPEVPATFLSPHVSPTSLPRGSQLGVDGLGEIHFVREEGFPSYNISYTKFGVDGSVQVPEKRVGPADTTPTYSPSLAVRGDGEVWIVHTEDYNTTVDALSVDGQELWTNRVVHQQQPFNMTPPLPALSWMKWDQTADRLLLTLRDYDGGWLQRFNRSGAMEFAQPVGPFPSQTFFTVPEAAATADGTTHLAWVNGSSAFYAAVDADGSVSVNSTWIPGSRVSNPPRVVGLDDGRAAIFWTGLDPASARWNIHFSVSEPDGTGGWTLSEPFQLTNTTGNSTQPWVTKAPDGTVYVAWVDDKDGDREVYYVYRQRCGVALRFDAQGYAAAYVIHPRQAGIINLSVENIGVVPVTANLTVDLPSALGSAGWTAVLGANALASLTPGESRNTTLTVTAGPNGTDGTNANYTVRVTDSCILPGATSIGFVHVLRVERGLSLGGPPPLGTVAPGSEWPLPVAVENTGERAENGVSVSVDGGSLPTGISVSPPQQVLDLAVGERRSLNFTLAVAAEAPPAGSVAVRMRAWTADASVATPPITILLAVDTQFWLDVRVGQSTVYALPGESVAVPFDVESFGNLDQETNVSLRVEGVSAFPGWAATLDRTMLYMPSGRQETVTFFHRVANGALAGDSATYCLVAESALFQTNASACLEVVVLPVRDPLVVGTRFAMTVAAGRTTGFSFSVHNQGNALEEFTATIVEAPPGWTLFFNGTGAPSVGRTLAPGEQTDVGVTVGVPAAAMAGDHQVRLLVAFASGREVEVLATVTVLPRFGVEITAAPSEARAVPGANATFFLTVTNTGNRVDRITLRMADLPEAARWDLFTAGDPPVRLGGGVDGAPQVDLEPGQTMVLELRVLFPATAPPMHREFGAVAESSGQEESTAVLTLDQTAHDLAIADVSWLPAEPIAGDRVHVSVRIENRGTFDYGGGWVLQVGGATPAVGARAIPHIQIGGSVDFEFDWFPAAGQQDLTFKIGAAQVIEPQHLPYLHDLQAANNVFEVVIVVSPPAQGGLPFLGAPGLIVALAAASLALARRRRFSETRK